MAEPQYSADEVDAAIAALAEPGRLEHAQEVVTHAAPGLARVLDNALHAGGWFGQAHEEQITRVLSAEDGEREPAFRALLDEETQLGMLVGVAVGFELARELQAQRVAGGGHVAAVGGDPPIVSDPDHGERESA